MLAEHQIEFTGLSRALVSTLILFKVVLVLKYVPLGVWMDVILRTLLYAQGGAADLAARKRFG